MDFLLNPEEVPLKWPDSREIPSPPEKGWDVGLVTTLELLETPLEQSDDMEMFTRLTAEGHTVVRLAWTDTELLPHCRVLSVLTAWVPANNDREAELFDNFLRTHQRRLVNMFHNVQMYSNNSTWLQRHGVPVWPTYSVSELTEAIVTQEEQWLMFPSYSIADESATEVPTTVKTVAQMKEYEDMIRNRDGKTLASYNAQSVVVRPAVDYDAVESTVWYRGELIHRDSILEMVLKKLKQEGVVDYCALDCICRDGDVVVYQMHVGALDHTAGFDYEQMDKAQRSFITFMVKHIGVMLANTRT
jgi:hypothetical protein